MKTKQDYYKALKNACNEMRLDYFPQVEASELLFKVITLEDIYMPLSLSEDEYSPIPNRPSDFDIEEILRMIDEKLNKNERSEKNKNLESENIVERDESSVNSSSEEHNRNELNHTILIEADPGSGKTTFCKRLALAFINQDEAFFGKYSQENDLNFDISDLPVLIKCRNISELSVEQLNELDFEEIMFNLCSHDFRSYISGFNLKDFRSLVSSKNKQNLCLILDGWDEILDYGKAVAFSRRLYKYNITHPHYDIVITSRFSYVIPSLEIYNSRHFRIRPLSNDDVRCFCKKWYETVPTPNQNRSFKCETLTDQILNSNYYPIRFMMKNPLELSLLLTVSKNDGLLPSNKADLYEELVDLKIYWNMGKNNNILSAKETRVLLAYIASIFTKNKLLYCNENQLINMIKQALHDLEFVFSDETTCLSPKIIAKELSHTSILSKDSNANRFSFSDSNQGLHRQMQEYLTAYAIIAQYSDEEYNNMSPIDILEDKYTINGWDEVVTFIVLMKSGRLRKGIINSLIAKCSKDPDNSAVYTNLLFSFIIMNADISPSDRHRIYDSVFKNQITNLQINSIFEFVKGNSNNSIDFVNYITDKYFNSIEKDDIGYSFAYATIIATNALQHKSSPFEYAYELLLSKNQADIIAGLHMLNLLAWCKYEGISNAFASYYLQYRMSSKMVNKLKSLFKCGDYTWDTICCIREAVIANFVDFNMIFDDATVFNACEKLDKSKSRERSELILSLVPVFDPQFQIYTETSIETKIKYMQRLLDEINNKSKENIVFTFCICVSIGCFSQKELEENWRQIREIYSANYTGAATSRFSQLDEKYLSLLYDRMNIEYQFPEIEDMGSGSWQLHAKTKTFAVYNNANDNLVMNIKFPRGKLSEDADIFLGEELDNSIATNNNLAYLLRRHELKEISLLRSGLSTVLTQEDLLIEGVRTFTPISTINYALSLSNIHINTCGNYNKGKKFLSQISVFFKMDFSNWEEVFNWWAMLSVERNEYEGFVVLTWLYSLGVLKIEWLKVSTLQTISASLPQYYDKGKDFFAFNKAIIEYLE